MNFHRQYKLYKLGITVPKEYSVFFELVDIKITKLRFFENNKHVNEMFFMDSNGICVIRFLTSVKCVYIDLFRDHKYLNLDKTKIDEIEMFLELKILETYPFLEFIRHIQLYDLGYLSEMNLLTDPETVQILNP